MMDGKVKQVNCAVFSEEIARELGKKENDSDLEFFHRAHENKHVTFIYPKGYPEKINPLLQALHLSDLVVLDVDCINAALGEKIVAIDSMQKKHGFLVVGEVDAELLEKIIANTTLAKFEKVKREELLEKTANFEPGEKNSKTIIDLDSMFSVRGVGVVGLGFIAQGTLKKFEKLKLFPGEKEVLVKSIQVHDKDRQEAFSGERVGCSLKGCEPGEFSRGMVLAPEFGFGKEIELEFEKNVHFKGEITPNKQLHLQCRLQVVGCTVKSVSPLKLELGKEIAFGENEPVLLIDINAKPRVIGKGKIIH